MSRVFISYSGNRIDRAEIVYALREHGINPWRDVENLDMGDDTTETIEAELADCSGLILWINDAVLASDYVAQVELPAIARAARRRHLRIVPVFDGMSPENGSERISRLGIEIGDNHGHRIDPDADPPTTAAAIAAAYVRGHVRDARDAGADPVVRMVTFDDTAALRDRAVLNLDWRHHLSDASLTTDVEQRLRSALTTATAALKAIYGACEVTVAAKTHLPIAVALGYAFAEPTGCTLRLHRGRGDWITPADTDEQPHLEELGAPRGPVDATRASVEVSVARDVDAGLIERLAAGTRYRHRIILTPEGGPGRDSVENAGMANAWARQVSEVLTRLADRADVEHTDLYLATPVEVAIMIGWWANAAGHVDLMDWGKTGPYRRLGSLP